MEEAYKKYLEDAELKDTASTKNSFVAGWKAARASIPEPVAEVPPDLNR